MSDANTAAVAHAAGMAAETATTMSAAGVTSATLRPQGQRQYYRKRRDGHQAPHTQQL